MTREEQQAQALARWLDAVERGDDAVEPPSDVDPDVLAAIFTLRPDLAPAPRVSLDDVLADVGEGPFSVLEDPDGAEVVPFPVPAARPPEPVPAWRRWQGGLLGLAAAAAAVVLVVGSLESGPPGFGQAKELATSIPGDRRSVAPSASARAPGGASPDAVSAPDAEVAAPARPAAPLTDAVVRAELPEEGRADEAVDRIEASGGPTLQAKTRARAVAVDERAGPLAGAVAVAEPPADDDAVAVAEPPADDGAVAVAEPPVDHAGADGIAELAQTALPEAHDALEPFDPSPSRARRAPARGADRAGAGAPPPAPQSFAPAGAREIEAEAEAAVAREGSASDPPSDVRAAVDRATRLARRDPLAAARQVAPWIAPPADAGLLAAEAAARWALEGGEPAAAVTWARRGLALEGGSSAARARVEAVLREAEAALRE